MWAYANKTNPPRVVSAAKLPNFLSKRSLGSVREQIDGGSGTGGFLWWRRSTNGARGAQGTRTRIAYTEELGVESAGSLRIAAGPTLRAPTPAGGITLDGLVYAPCLENIQADGAVAASETNDRE